MNMDTGARRMARMPVPALVRRRWSGPMAGLGPGLRASVRCRASKDVAGRPQVHPDTVSKVA